VVPATSSAAKAGLQKNDLIQAANGQAVSDIGQLFKALSGIKSGSVTLKVVRDQQGIELTVALPAVVEIETASAANGFKKLVLPASPSGKVIANQKVSDFPIEMLADGQLANNYGPVFGNGIQDGAYKMDLGSVQAVAAITSWSYNQSRRRGAQKIALCGSNAATDPGWDMTEFTPLGTIDTGTAKANYTAASLRAVGEQTLGQFRWIVWSVSPVTANDGGENTAFQEFQVECVAAK
jgi:hypothetical protein